MTAKKTGQMIFPREENPIGGKLTREKMTLKMTGDRMIGV